MPQSSIAASEGPTPNAKIQNILVVKIFLCFSGQTACTWLPPLAGFFRRHLADRTSLQSVGALDRV